MFKNNIEQILEYKILEEPILIDIEILAGILLIIIGLLLLREYKKRL